GWQLYPLLRVAWLSFTNYEALHPDETKWVGLDNYTRAISDPLVREGLKRAAVFTLLFLPGAIIFPLITAVGIQRIKETRSRRLFRMFLLLPAMMPAPMIFLLWRWMYNPSIGPFNYLLVDVFGVFNIRDVPRWVGDPHLVLPSIVIMEWWWGIGYHTV